MYADDLTVTYACSSFTTTTIELNNTLELIQNWSINNSLTINTKKTVAMCFTNSNSIDTSSHTLILDNDNINYVKSLKFLGVFLDPKLKFTEYYNYLIKKLSAAAGALYRIRNLVSINSKIQLFNSLFQSFLYYCPIAISYFNSVERAHLLSIQKRAVRSIFSLKFRDHTLPFFNDYNILRIDLIVYRGLVLNYLRSYFFPDSLALSVRIRSSGHRNTRLCINNSRVFEKVDFNKPSSCKLYNWYITDLVNTIVAKSDLDSGYGVIKTTVNNKFLSVRLDTSNWIDVTDLNDLFKS
jgi:hypothetical protein